MLFAWTGLATWLGEQAYAAPSMLVQPIGIDRYPVAGRPDAVPGRIEKRKKPDRGSHHDRCGHHTRPLASCIL